MNLSRAPRICVVPRLSGVGGMVSFQHKLIAGLHKRGVAVTQDLTDVGYQAVLVIGGTRHLAGLWRAHKRRVPVIQRLNGMNWLHRIRSPEGKLRTGWRHYLRAEYGNWILSLIRKRFASTIVYQSEFTCGWWQRVYGATTASYHVIYNGVDLDIYSPADQPNLPEDSCRLLMVEGSLMGGYEQGLQAALEMAQQLSGLFNHSNKRKVELRIIGRVPKATRAISERRLAELGSDVQLEWVGLVAPDRISDYDRSAHLLYSSDVNAACPNSVIEALACGLPVVAFDTGALPELITSDAGRIVPYGGDPWRLEPPDVPALAGAALEVLQEQECFRQGARKRAEEAFGLNAMLDAYQAVLFGS